MAPEIKAPSAEWLRSHFGRFACCGNAGYGLAPVAWYGDHPHAAFVALADMRDLHSTSLLHRTRPAEDWSRVERWATQPDRGGS